MTSQDQFEAWASEHLPTLYLAKTDQGTYESTATGSFFAAWSARDGEIERLTKQWGGRPAYRTAEYESRRDAMWRRAHMVATSKGYDHINMAIAAAPKACTDCMGCGGEWQGEGQPNSVCETCKGSRGKTLEAERDQLKATVADYEMGLEAAKEEIARLKGDNEGLRKDAERLNWIDENYSGFGTGTEFNLRLHLPCDIEDGGLIHAIDFAMSKGEQP